MAKTKPLPKKNGHPKISPSEWLNQAEELFSPEEANELRARLAAKIQAEHDRALKRAKELEAELRQLGVADAPDEEEPAPEWSMLRLVKYYLRRHPGSAVGPIIEFVRSVRPDDDMQNVNSVLYKYSGDGKPFEKRGDRHSYTYSLREEADRGS